MRTTLDVLFGGRALLGLGAAWYGEEADGFGLPFPPLGERMERVEEVVQVCLQMWSGSQGPYTGKHYQMERTLTSPMPVSQPRPRIMIAGNGKRKTLRMVAKYAAAGAVAIGAGTMTMVTAVNITVQMGTEDHVRGRVMGLCMLVLVGGGALGGPVIGAIDRGVGPQLGMLTPGLVPEAETALVAVRLFICGGQEINGRARAVAGTHEIEVTWDEQDRQRL